MYLRWAVENQMVESLVTGSDCPIAENNLENKIEPGDFAMPENPIEAGEYNRKDIKDCTGGSQTGGQYCCSRCGNAYTRPHSLNRHRRFECGVEPKFECPICHKKSKHKHNLLLHMRTHKKPWKSWRILRSLLDTFEIIRKVLVILLRVSECFVVVTFFIKSISLDSAPKK